MQLTDFDEFQEILLRLVVAMVLGGAIGINRDLHRKPAGLRVLAMVSVAAALATLLALFAAAQQKVVTYDGFSRVLQGILQGIGFLGAGVIMHAQGRDDVHGMTTAAAVWLTAVIGVACGMGQWQMSVAAFMVSVFILTVGRHMEKALIHWSPHEKSSDGGESRPRTL